MTNASTVLSLCEIKDTHTHTHTHTHTNCDGFFPPTACPMGEVSSYLVAHNSYVRLPVGGVASGRFRVCKCGHDAMLTKCHNMERIGLDSCLLPSGRIHGESRAPHDRGHVYPNSRDTGDEDRVREILFCCGLCCRFLRTVSGLTPTNLPVIENCVRALQDTTR